MNKYRVTGKHYNETPNYYVWDSNKRFPYFTVDDEQEWVINADNLKEAEKWFAVNHPDYLMGGAINCITPNVHEFCIYAVPCSEYGEGNYETVDARVAFIRNRLVA